VFTQVPRLCGRGIGKGNGSRGIRDRSARTRSREIGALASVIALCVSVAKESELVSSRPALQLFRNQSGDAVSVLAPSARHIRPALSVVRKLSHMRAIIQHRARHEVAAPYNKRLQSTRSKQRAPETRRWA
jgi:hypothetical protein